jgi:hypothetical protein
MRRRLVGLEVGLGQLRELRGTVDVGDARDNRYMHALRS